ncbi:MAG: (Fe-S)-binding protein [Desulfohalobiaceae bacterium]|nr:(Fe-S)-binding protein [Desulfohalobiaceae bacterium]
MPGFSKISFFVPCLVDTLYPEVGRAVLRVLEKAGLKVDCPLDQTCCGQVAFNAGYQTQARRLAKRFITLFEEAEVIVCPSGSCSAMVKHQYPLLLQADPAWHTRARDVAAKAFEFTQFLVDILGVTDLGARCACRATYHDSCHLNRHLGISRQPRRLLQAIQDLTLVEMEDSDRCCGFGGSFSLKYPDISLAILQDKIEAIQDTGADIVVGCDMGCLMNIQGRLNRLGSSVQVKHIAQVLAQETKT